MIYNFSSERRQAAFGILADIVQRWYAEGRRAYGASLKPELRALTSNEFDERLLGFMSFKQFLTAAADTGIVDVTPRRTLRTCRSCPRQGADEAAHRAGLVSRIAEPASDSRGPLEGVRGLEHRV